MRGFIVALIVPLRPSRLGLGTFFISWIYETGFAYPFGRSVAVCVVADILAVKAACQVISSGLSGYDEKGKGESVLVSMPWEVWLLADGTSSVDRTVQECVTYSHISSESPLSACTLGSSRKSGAKMERDTLLETYDI